MTKPILVWFGFTAVVRYQTLFLEEAKDIFQFLSGTLQSKGPLKIILYVCTFLFLYRDLTYTVIVGS